jgi:hypothetical protein
VGVEFKVVFPPLIPLAALAIDTPLPSSIFFFALAGPSKASVFLNLKAPQEFKDKKRKIMSKLFTS